MNRKTLEAVSGALSGPARIPNNLVEQYVAGNHRDPFTPEVAKKEMKALARKSKVNLIGLVLRSLIEDLAITDYSHPDAPRREAAWQTWLDAKMPSKADFALRHAAVHGHSYQVLIPQPEQGRWDAAVFAPHEVYAEWADFANDPRPTILACRWPGHPGYAVMWDADRRVSIVDLVGKTEVSVGTTSPQLFEGTEPVVRQTSGDWAMNGSGHLTPTGEVNPLINANDRVNQAVMDLMLVQTFGAVTLRTVAGIELADEEEEARAQKIDLAVDRILTANHPETRFGVLTGTPMDPFIKNVDAAIRHFAITAQIPPNRLLGELENIGADAILVARESQESKLTKYREQMGERHELFLRALCAANRIGDPGPEGYFSWRATELRTIAEIADAAAKLSAVGLNIEPLVRASVRWRSNMVDELFEGYQESRTQPSADVAAIVGSVERQSRALARVPARASSADGAPEAATA